MKSNSEFILIIENYYLNARKKKINSRLLDQEC